MPTTDKQQAAAAALAHRAQRVSMLRNRAMAGVIATFVIALGAVGFTGSMGETDSATSGNTAALVDGSSDSSSSSSEDSTSTWSDDSASSDDSTAADDSSSSEDDDVAPMTSGQS